MTTENSTSNTNERLDRIERNLEKLIAIQALNAVKQTEAPRGSVEHSVIADLAGLMENPIFSGDLSALELASKPIDNKWEQVINQCKAAEQVIKLLQIIAQKGDRLGPFPSQLVSLSDDAAINCFKPIHDHLEATLNNVASYYSDPSHEDLRDTIQSIRNLFSKSF